MYSEQVMKHFANPRNMGALEDADGEGRAGEPGRGNYMIVWVKLDGERIERLGFKTYGCPPAIAAGSCITEMATGRTVQGALSITREELIEALGGLPLGREHCAALAIEALTDAISRTPDDGQQAGAC
ncbi:MAG: iron-sulfur cluster assembly scaffold protein [Armatimonadota bacterium]|nr:iron-sulfur cluster assembly scaffold protein [Armatimonadota bacterium]